MKNILVGLSVLQVLFLASCSRNTTSQFLDAMRANLYSHKNDFQALPAYFKRNFRNVESIEFKNGKCTILIYPKNGMEQLRYGDISFAELVENGAMDLAGITKEELQELNERLIEVNCSGIRQFLKSDSGVAGSVEVLYQRTNTVGYFYCFYAGKKSRKDQLILEKSKVGFFIADSLAVYSR